jgi:transposase
LSVNLQALLVGLGNYGHLSYGLTELWWELGRIKVGVGTLQKTNQPVAAAVKPAIKALWEWACEQSNVHVDQTPWCVMGVKEWLWTASGEGFCLFPGGVTTSLKPILCKD